MSFKDKVVLVTGASSGIGAATAILFTKEGANVAMVGRNETKLKSVAEQCAAVGGAPLVIRADVSNDDDARRIINETIERFGSLDVLVNNAGVLRFGSLLSGDVPKAFDDVININLRAVIHLTALATPHIIQNKGNIINISSIGGQMIMASKLMAYCSSKAGLDHFTRACAMELAPSGVRVNTISPGPVTTDIMENTGVTPDEEELTVNPPLNRVSDSEEIADVVFYLAGEKSRGITGSIFVVDNGVMLK